MEDNTPIAESNVLPFMQDGAVPPELKYFVELIRVSFDGCVRILAEMNRHESAVLDRKLSFLKDSGAKINGLDVSVDLVL